MIFSSVCRGLAAAVLLVAAPAAAGDWQPPPEPVVRHGAKLYLERQPWRAVGLYSPDAAFGPAASQCQVASTLPALRRHQTQVVEHAVRMGAHVLKVLAYQQAMGPSGTDFTALDQLVLLARERDLRLLLVLETHAGPCTPRLEEERSSAWYVGGWREPYDGYTMGLRDYAEQLAHRYAGELTVLGYQLVDGAPAGVTGHVLQHLHGDLARLIRVRAPVQLLVGAGQLDPSLTAQAVEAWQTAHRVSLLDVLSVEDLDQPDSPLPAHLMAALVGARRLQRPLWVGAGGVRLHAYTPRDRAERVVDKVTVAAHVGAGGYFHYSGISLLPEAREFCIGIQEPLGRTLPYLAANEWAAVPGCMSPGACPDSPPRVSEPAEVH